MAPSRLWSIEYGVVGWNAVLFGNSIMFRGNLLPSSSGLNGKPSKKPAEAGGKPRCTNSEILKMETVFSRDK
jgi:hypothetical protein